MNNDEEQRPKYAHYHPGYFVVLLIFCIWLFGYGKQLDSEATLTLVLIVLMGFASLAYHRGPVMRETLKGIVMKVLGAIAIMAAVDLAFPPGLEAVLFQLGLVAFLIWRLMRRL
jgi:hypothetical protein